MSVKQSIGCCQNRNCLSFDRKRRDRVGWSTVQMPLCVVAWPVLAAVLASIPQLVAKTCGVSCGPADAEQTVEMLACIILQMQRRCVWLRSATKLPELRRRQKLFAKLWKPNICALAARHLRGPLFPTLRWLRLLCAVPANHRVGCKRAPHL